MQRVVVLGAGFSRAISDEMPLMKELGPMVLDRLGLHHETLKPFNDDVESWLGYIGSDEPWLEDSENLRNRAKFVDAVRAIHDVIYEAQYRASETTPVWLQRLVEEWTEEQAQACGQW